MLRRIALRTDSPPNCLRQIKTSRHLWTTTLTDPISSFISTSTSAPLNLSIEHYLLRNSPPTSTLLFLYTNSPSVVFGRNQNPWLELNLPAALKANRTGALDIVRRRSGGGTVYHDLGNVNWTVICPPESFTRDKHVEMMTRALRSCGVERARVNVRHDIVLDQGREKTGVACDAEDMHVTPWTSSETNSEHAMPLKVSGSAYKLTKGRALHHGTCLLSSDLKSLGKYLRSPAKNHIQAKGVESVSSPVGNAAISHEAFIAAVRREFSQMYVGNGNNLQHTEINAEDALREEELKKGHEELKSNKWIYGQTPNFTFTVTPEQSRSIEGLPDSLHLRMSVGKASSIQNKGANGHKSTITELSIMIDGNEVVDDDFLKGIGQDDLFHEPRRQEEATWSSVLEGRPLQLPGVVCEHLAAFLDKTLPIAMAGGPRRL